MGSVRHTHMLIAILHTIFGGKVIISLYIFLTEKLFEVFRWWFGFPYRSQVWWQCIVTNHLTVSSCFLCKCNLSEQLPSMLWCHWFGSIQSIRPVKNFGGNGWCGYQSGTRCRLAYGLEKILQCHSLSLASVKSRSALPFRFRLTRAVAVSGLFNGCVCVDGGHLGLLCIRWTFCWQLETRLFDSVYIRTPGKRLIFAPWCRGKGEHYIYFSYCYHRKGGISWRWSDVTLKYLS